jgi:hypothetical protein
VQRCCKEYDRCGLRHRSSVTGRTIAGGGDGHAGGVGVNVAALAPPAATPGDPARVVEGGAGAASTTRSFAFQRSAGLGTTIREVGLSDPTDPAEPPPGAFCARHSACARIPLWASIHFESMRLPAFGSRVGLPHRHPAQTSTLLSWPAVSSSLRRGAYLKRLSPQARASGCGASECGRSRFTLAMGGSHS